MTSVLVYLIIKCITVLCKENFEGLGTPSCLQATTNNAKDSVEILREIKCFSNGGPWTAGVQKLWGPLTDSIKMIFWHLYDILVYKWLSLAN